MNESQFTEEQIVALLAEVDAGEQIQGLCAKLGISEATFQGWRSKYQGARSLESKRMKQLEEENQRLRSLVADLTLRNQALKRVVSKKW